MITNEIQTALEQAANYNLGIASRKGEVAICQTKLGTVYLSKIEGGFRMSWTTIAQGKIDTKTIEGKKAFIRSALCNVFQIA